MSAAVAVDSSHKTASSTASWRRFSPPSDFVNGHVSTMWFMVCHWPQSQEGDWARPNLCKLARHGPWPVRKRFIRDHVWRGRSKPGCRIVGSVTIVWLTTEADDQSSLHCITVSTDDSKLIQRLLTLISLINVCMFLSSSNMVLRLGPLPHVFSSCFWFTTGLQNNTSENNSGTTRD